MGLDNSAEAGRELPVRGMKLSRWDKLGFHGHSLFAGRRVSSSMTERQGQVAHNPNEGWGWLSSLVHLEVLLCPQLSQTKKSADLSGMIKPINGFLDLCLLSIMNLTGRAYRLAVNRKATVMSSNLVSSRTPDALISHTLSCMYPCSMPMRQEPKEM